MVFASPLFLFWFLPTVLGLYYLVPCRARQLTLTVVSYVFYGWADPLFVPVMMVSTVWDYAAGLAIAGERPWGKSPPVALPTDEPRTRWQTLALTASIVGNLGLLGFFKYAGLFSESWNTAVAALDGPPAALLPVLRVCLPLGISFYTFQSMSYTIDVYRGRAAPIRSLLDFACFVSMFPQLVAGPIVRFTEVADQLAERSHTVTKFARGAAFVVLGLARKLLIADNCARVADAVFDADPAAVGTLEAWLGAVAYAFQIYFDFAGYSDMAVGLGLMFGFVLPRNFDSPYTAGSLTEFWRRWHISLSTWLRDYLYIPMGGNRRGKLRTYVNLLVVMLLGGLWHGAAWTFVVWGGLHGLGLAVERAGLSDGLARLPRPLIVGLTFAVLCLMWVWFRADTAEQASRLWGVMFGLSEPDSTRWLLRGLITQPVELAWLLIASAVTWGGVDSWDWTRQLTPLKAVVLALLSGLALLAMAFQGHSPFLYFIF